VNASVHFFQAFLYIVLYFSLGFFFLISFINGIRTIGVFCLTCCKY
jgi:hypothetical protein